MSRRLASCILCLVTIILLTPSAMAANDVISVKVNRGDTVYGLCQSCGLDYYAQKDVIMVLNGLESEAQLNTLREGDTLLLPAASSNTYSYTANVISAGDKIEYYVIPYVIQKGDSIANVYHLWGLRFEKYAEAIKSLNGVDNLDLLYVGAIYLLPTTEENLQTDVYTTVMSHIMKTGETAYDVFTSYGIDYYESLARLQNYNGGADLTKIQVGQKLLIPLN